jgi:hypothetical protein
MTVKQNLIRTLVLASVCMFVFSACKKTTDPKDPEPKTFGSVAEFYASNQVKSEMFTFDAATGGNFTTAKGTEVRIPANCFVDSGMNVVSGTVVVEFKDLYSKSDILFSGIQTTTFTGMLKSAGEFFILAEKNGKALDLAPGKNIEVEQPADGAVDTAMAPFQLQRGVGGGQAWGPSIDDVLGFSPNSYIFGLYSFGNPASEGTWCNSDNSVYFSAFTNTVLTLTPDANQNPSTYGTDVYLIFTGINSMIHVYANGSVFPYNFAPIGLECTVVAIGVKDGKLQSAFVPITISSGQNVTFTLTETTEDAFKAALTALN